MPLQFVKKISDFAGDAVNLKPNTEGIKKSGRQLGIDLVLQKDKSIIIDDIKDIFGEIKKSLKGLKNNLLPQNLGELIKRRKKGRLSESKLATLDELENAEGIQVKDGVKRVVIGVGGRAGKAGRSSSYVQKEIKKLVDRKNTQVEGFNNEFSDASVPLEEGDGEEFIFQALLKDLQIFLTKGYNPDAVKLAAKVMKTRENTDLPIDLYGYSHGGFVVEEAIAILKELGQAKGVNAVGLGTPDYGSGFDNEEYRGYLGESDRVRANDFLGQDLFIAVFNWMENIMLS